MYFVNSRNVETVKPWYIVEKRKLRAQNRQRMNSASSGNGEFTIYSISSPPKSIEIFFPEIFELKILSKSERKQKKVFSFVKTYCFTYTIMYDNLDRYDISDHLEFIEAYSISYS